MSDKNSIFRLTGKVQHYQWGGYDYIPKLLGMNNDQHQPFAEYWLGAHDNAPAQLTDGSGLNDLIKKQPAHLGDAAQKKFGRLPYLLKILDVKDMLSIQVHPSKKAAEQEFADENKKGTPLNAGHRNYKDDNHKPELMMALSDFWLLHGFQEPKKLKATLAAVPELTFLLPVFGENNYKALYENVMTMDQAEVNKVLQPLLDHIIPLYKADKLQKNNPDFWAARAALTFNVGDNIDRGIFSIYLFNVLNVKPGDAVFQDAGLLHAYLEGQNVEIMANSDNVLRGGLTPKHIDVAELLKHVVFEPTIPNILKGDTVSAAERVFKTPAPDFELSKILLTPSSETQLNIASTDIFLVLSGKATASTATDRQEFTKGEAFAAVSGSSIKIDSAQGAEIYRASVPG
ncbi:MAG: mannose-6-phosphate isomerase, class I [Chitinophagaceae bacterium]